MTNNNQPDVSLPDTLDRRAGWIGAAVLSVLLLVVYATTMHPGIAAEDAADTQTMSALLGICHPPGYALLVLAGSVFAHLPLGGELAWRVNLLLMVSGILGCLALYGAIRRITGRVLPALVGATTLGFSSIYWTHALYAEVYVFYGMLLLVGLYCAVRFAGSDRSLWLYLTAICLGACVANRPSELFVLPAFALLWFAFRKRVKLDLRRLAICGLLFVIPYAATVGYYWLRENPAQLHARDDALRDAILEVGPPFNELPFGTRLKQAMLYTTGLKWASRAEFDAKRFEWDADKLIYLLAGHGALHDRFGPTDAIKQDQQTRGASIGILGVLLAVVGVCVWRRRDGWVLLGVGLFAGNIAFYFYHHPPDNLDFTIPGIAGLALLAGLGAAMPTKSARWRRIVPIVAMSAPLFLLVGNYAKLDQSTPTERARQQRLALVAAAPLPENAVIVARYPHAMTFRYLFHVKADRHDVSVIINRYRYTRQQATKLIQGFVAQRRPVFLDAREWPRALRQQLERQTPRALVEAGLLQFTR